ncbi:hypothetical protein JJB98_21765 [Bradyrhizobium diazoefficiens]|nr:hypothetical protein [Bradyrhizobium diazoefficiens]QQO22375.1 hypothetical protein JJB98_21765 [Bradyrhizobium diazoefficiens]
MNIDISLPNTLSNEDTVEFQSIEGELSQSCARFFPRGARVNPQNKARLNRGWGRQIACVSAKIVSDRVLQLAPFGARAA